MSSKQLSRRHILQSAAAMSLLGLTGCATTSIPQRAKVVVVGGGYGGATAAKYVRWLSDYKIDVVLIEPQEAFVSCPISNLVLSGVKQMADITTPSSALSKRHGVTVVKDIAKSIDTRAKTVTLGGGATIGYDKLIVSPGIDLQFDTIEGLRAANASGQIVQAWKAGPETVALRRQLEAMPDGGVFAITIPEAPYRCPPGPYERASVVAGYFKANKPRSKVLILDANQDVTSKGPLFKRVWNEQYKGILEYRPQHKVTAVDAKAGVIKFDVQEDVKAQVLNVLPSMRAGAIAVQTGLNNLGSNRWCGVNYLNFESTVAKDVHVLGDAILAAPAMPKSGHMANSQAKVAAMNVRAELTGARAFPARYANTCWSLIAPDDTVKVGGSYASKDGKIAAVQTFVSKNGETQAMRKEQQGENMGWYAGITNDMFG